MRTCDEKPGSEGAGGSNNHTYKEAVYPRLVPSVITSSYQHYTVQTIWSDSALF